MHYPIILLGEKIFRETTETQFTFTNLIMNEVMVGLTLVGKGRRGNDCECENSLKSKLCLFRANSDTFGHKLQAQTAIISQGRKLLKVVMMGDIERGKWMKATCLRQSHITSSGFLRGNFLGHPSEKIDWFFQGLTQRISALFQLFLWEKKVLKLAAFKNQEKFGKQAQEHSALTRRTFFSRMECDKFLANLLH